MPNIMQLKDQAKELFDKLDEMETDEFLRELEVVAQKGMQVIAPLCDLIDELNARGEARKNKASELHNLATKDIARAGNIKESITKIMSMLNQKKIENGALTVTLCPGNPALEIEDETLIPMGYVKATITIPATQLDLAKTVLDNIERSLWRLTRTPLSETRMRISGLPGQRLSADPTLKSKDKGEPNENSKDYRSAWNGWQNRNST